MRDGFGGLGVLGVWEFGGFGFRGAPTQAKRIPTRGNPHKFNQFIRQRHQSSITLLGSSKWFAKRSVSLVETVVPSHRVILPAPSFFISSLNAFDMNFSKAKRYSRFALVENPDLGTATFWHQEIPVRQVMGQLVAAARWATEPWG